MSALELSRSSPLRLILVVLILAGLSFVALGHQEPPAQPRPEPPPVRVKLAVLVVFDQLRGDYLERWQSYFGPAGFQRLMKEGAWFDNCHYPYALTKTAPGHASMLTGCSPAQHGIIDNDWFDRNLGKPVYCVDSTRYKRVPPKPNAKGTSPERLLAPGVADVLKQSNKGKGRVVCLSLKDRSAVLPGGKQPDACYWFDSSAGEFVTSTYYRDLPQRWVSDFNKSGFIDQWRGKNWTPFEANLDLKKLGLFRDPDDEPGDFEHPLPAGKDPKYYAKVAESPFGNNVLLELAKRAIVAENLGQDEYPDLLSISFSSNDLIGHRYGPDSPEVMDVTVRSDGVVAELLDFLDEKVGKGQYVLALSADHGVCPLPEVSKQRGLEAERISLRSLTEDAALFLDEKFGDPQKPARWFDSFDESWVYFNRAALKSRGLALAEVADALAHWIERQPGLQAAYTSRDLFDKATRDDPLARAVRRSFYPGRAGDIVLFQKPRYLFSSSFTTGTTHGTPHPYDTHVPLLVYGPDIEPGRRGDRVKPQDIAAIFTYFLGIPPPGLSDASLPDHLVQAR
ncbi:MAG: alkaline phosphatase family protein [Gemmataceae bacterium]